MDDLDHPKPLPAFYCCYLLRSSVKHASLYIGSTPHPARRLAQHNGEAKGGAKKTSNDKRPWEMVLIVEGFTSRIAALQFEWAWQNTRDTRHIQSEEAVARSRRKPRRSLTTHLGDLHRLLCSTLFSQWPLQVRFFAADVYRLWRIWRDRDGGVLPSHMHVVLDGNCPATDSGVADAPRFGSVCNIKVDHSDLESYLEKSAFLLDDPEDLRCKVCQTQVNPRQDMTVVCPQEGCYCISHLLCLSSKFLDATKDPDRLVPVSGTCPGCKKTVPWSLMMRELSLRSRGSKEVQDILKRKKRNDRKANKPSAVTVTGETDHATKDSAEKPDSELNAHEDVPLDENWSEQVDFESDSSAGKQSKAPTTGQRVEIVIEDSEDDLDLL